MAVGDLYKAVVEYTVYDEICTNAFWYRQTATDGSVTNNAESLANSLKNLFCDPVGNLQSVEVDYTAVRIWNYTDGTEQYVLNPPSVGTQVGDALPPQYCLGVKMNRPGLGWNYPRKRISGFRAADYSQGEPSVAIEGSLTTIFNNLRAMNYFSDTFQWVIIRPAATFELGNVVLLGEGTVGTVLDVYDATQNTRR